MLPFNLRVVYHELRSEAWTAYSHYPDKQYRRFLRMLVVSMFTPAVLLDELLFPYAIDGQQLLTSE